MVVDMTIAFQQGNAAIDASTSPSTAKGDLASNRWILAWSSLPHNCVYSRCSIANGVLNGSYEMAIDALLTCPHYLFLLWRMTQLFLLEE
jgi:hypothetical protein